MLAVVKTSVRTYASISAAAAAARNAARVPLLLPIPLYRRLLRAHRLYLPAEMRLLGDEYVKAEFRAHRKLDNPAQVVSFFLFLFFSFCWVGWRGEGGSVRVEETRLMCVRIDWLPYRVADVSAAG